MKIKIVFILLCSIITFSGCTYNRSAQVYHSSEALQTEDVREGIVESIQPVLIRKDERVVGTIGGTAIGGIAASTAGKGRGNAIITVIGAIVGGLIGNQIEMGITDTKGWQIVVKFNNGKKIAVVQEADINFEIGERVNVFTGRRYNISRVAKISINPAVTPDTK
ncbi:MAG: glycine zipper 2TM domain-containing protein [Bacteroidales bacterium]|nr:glycine zipper 2TM domain-containing protein [Bacteroidales bacterium]